MPLFGIVAGIVAAWIAVAFGGMALVWGGIIVGCVVFVVCTGGLIVLDGDDW